MPLPTIIIFDIAIITLAALYIVIDIITILRRPLIHLNHELFEPSFQLLPATSPLQHHKRSPSTTMSEPVFSILLQENIIAPNPTPAAISYSPNDGYQSSESSYSDGSYNEEEYQMGLEYWRQSGRSEDSYPYNDDGTFYLSPAIVDQIALVNKPDLNQDEKDLEIERLVDLIDQEIRLGSPRGPAIDLADAIEEGRFNPWDNRSSHLASKDRVFMWKAMNPEIFVSYATTPPPTIGEPESDSSPCACDHSDPDVLCFGDICAVVKEGSSVSQAVRAENLFNARVMNDEMAMLIKERDEEAGFVEGRYDGYVEVGHVETFVDE